MPTFGMKNNRSMSETRDAQGARGGVKETIRDGSGYRG